MKQLITMILALSLLLSAALCGASAEDGLKNCVCAEDKYVTKIPVVATAVYSQEDGLTVYTENEGYIPYVIIHRRPLDMKFKNPENYLNNVYREYMENKYTDQYLGMIGIAKNREIGGKQLLTAEYRFRIGDATIVQLTMLEIREAGDVEYIAKYVDGKGQATLAALDAIVLNYHETDAVEDAEEPAPSDTGSDAAVPSFLTPSVFVDKYNVLINTLADYYSEQLGEEGVQIVKEDYAIVQEDIQGPLAYYGNKAWSVEAAFVFPDEGSVSYNTPALQLNFNIRNDVPDTIMDFATYAVKMMIAYEYQDQITLDDLSAWFSSAENLSEPFNLPGYQLSLLKNEEHTQYLFLLSDVRNPYKPE